MHATAGRPPRNFQVVCSRPPPHGIWKRHAIWRSQSCFLLPSVFTLVSNEHIPKVAKRLVQLTHKPNIEQQLIWAGHLSGGGANGFWRVLSQKGGGWGGRICQKNRLSILRTTCCLFWWKWKYIFLESFESVNSRRKSPSCGRTKKSSNISLEAKKQESQ